MAVVGIDLGTTNTVVAFARDGHVSTVRGSDGEYLIPSVVSFHPTGGVLVGRQAKDRRVVDAMNTVYSIKRLIGRSWNSEEVARARARFPFEMREGPGQAALVVARGETFTLPEISAFVLRHARTMAEKVLGEAVERAVITVPANFNDLQRAATKVAGRVAGIEVLRILNEPTAAALAYGYGKGKGERIAIYDFGGGTFDVTLLDLSGNVFEVLATAGNTFLGGDDIDLAIAEEMAQTCATEHHVDARADPQIFERLRYYAERLKMDLSAADSATVDVPDVGRGPGGKPLRLTFSMSRAQIEALARPLVERTFDVCREALSIARLAPDALDQVVLVGGSTRLPIVRSAVEEFFKRRPLDRINPDEVVAIGAAIQASALTGAAARRSVIPKPPMPAARSFEESAPFRLPRAKSQPPGQKSQPPPHPHAKRTDPALPKPPLPRTPGSGAAPPEGGAPRRRVITGMGLGPTPKAAAEPLPLAEGPEGAAPRLRLPTSAHQRPPPPRKGGTLGGVGDPPAGGSPPAVSASAEKAEAPLGEVPTRVSWDPPTEPRELEKPKLASHAFDPDDEPTHVGPAPEVLETMARAALQAEEPAPSKPPISREAAEEWGTAPDLGEPPPVPSRSRPAPASRSRPASASPSPPASERPLSQKTRELFAIAPDPRPAAKGPPLKPPPDLPRERPAPPLDEPLAFAQAAPVVQRLDLDEPDRRPPPALPLLIDVTPLSLCVETVGGFRDVIIPRNSPVPCERERSFVTARHGQTIVRVRVGQGESERFSDDTLLGELELGGLRAAERGDVQVVVTFSLDTDGMLEVRAADGETGKATAARLRLIGVPDSAEVLQMTARQTSHRNR